jgi:hypothetical protein
MSRASEKEVEEEAIEFEQQGPLPISKLEVCNDSTFFMFFSFKINQLI